MKIIEPKLIQQCEAAKDVIWFLKGAIKSDEYYPLGNVHIEAIEDLIHYVYKIELEKGNISR